MPVVDEELISMWLRPASENGEGFWGRWNKTTKSIERVGTTYEGDFAELWLSEDEGNPSERIAPHTKLIIVLKDDDYNVKLVGKLNTWFGRYLGEKILTIDKGERIRVGVKQGNDNKVLFPNVAVVDENGAKYISLPKIHATDEDMDEYVDGLILRLTSHPAYSPKTSKDELPA